MDEASVEQYIKVIAEIAVEEWRFRRTFERIMKMLDDMDRQKFKSQYVNVNEYLSQVLANI